MTLSMLFLIAIIGIFLSILVASVLGYRYKWQWTGLPYFPSDADPNEVDNPERRYITMWGWLTLLVVPLTLGIVGLYFAFTQQKSALRVQSEQAKNALKVQSEQAKNALKVQSERAKDEALQAYLDQMSALMLDHQLRTSEKDDAVRDLALARTLTVVKRQGPEGKADVVNFLYEAGLIKEGQPKEGQPIVSLVAAHLEEARLSNAKLQRVNLSNTYLQKADFYWADLDHSNMYHSDLHDANLLSAGLREANLSYTDLSGADFTEVRDLEPAVLRGADLSGADLSKAKFSGVDLTEADLSEAIGWTEKQLTAAKTLEGATMPDGQVLKSADNPDGPTLEEWLKSHGEENTGP